MLTRLTTSVWLKGTRFEIRVVTRSGKAEVFDFIQSLEQQDRNQVMARLRTMADHGALRNVQHSRHLGDGIYEFKTKNVRIFWFYQRNQVVILTHGRMKKEVRVAAELKQAKELRDELKGDENQ